MQSIVKTKVISVLSMAVAATVGGKASRGATLTLYYDNIKEVAPDGTTIVQSYNYSTSGGNYSNIPTTINIAAGDTFEFGIDAVVTNNVNPDAGKSTGTPGHIAVQPSYLGLATLSIAVPSSDAHAGTLVPNTAGLNGNTIAGVPDYNDSISLNNSTGLGTSAGPNNNPGGFAPIWGYSVPGDVTPMSGTGGDVGYYFPIFQGNGGIA
jgi:hypothetical protein